MLHLPISKCYIQLYATSECQAFVHEVNGALLRVSPTESTDLPGDFNAHAGRVAKLKSSRSSVITRRNGGFRGQRSKETVCTQYIILVQTIS